MIQSDQGSNFPSHLFTQVLKQLKVRHNQASPYHAESQGALERFHQTLKSLLRGYCVQLNHDWEEGLPWLLLAAREVVQESTGFSPNELVFGHTVRGPLTLLCDAVVKPEPPRTSSTISMGSGIGCIWQGKWPEKSWFLPRRTQTGEIIYHQGEKIIKLHATIPQKLRQ